MEGAEKQSKDETAKSQIAIRCAKAALLICSLKSSPNRTAKPGQDEEREEAVIKEVEELKIELARARMKNRRIKVCSLMEVVLQVVVVLSLWTFCLMLALF